MPATVSNKQWLGDIALQTSGSIEALFALAAANGMSITDDAPNGKQLLTVSMVNSRVQAWYSNGSIFPATSLSVEDAAMGGIGIWAVEVNFKVS